MLQLLKLKLMNIMFQLLQVKNIQEVFFFEVFNQRIINYVMEEIEKDKRFEKINLENKNERNIFTLNYINTKTEEVKIDLSYEEESVFLFHH